MLEVTKQTNNVWLHFEEDSGWTGLWRKTQSFITGNMTGGILMNLILWLRSMLPPQNEVTQYFLIKGTKTMWKIMSRVSKTKGCQRLRTALLPDSKISFLWLFLHLLHKAPYLCSAYCLECQLFAPCRQGILQEKMLQCLVLDGHFYDPLPHWFCSVVLFLQLSSCSKPVPIYTLQQKTCATSCSLALGIPCEFTDPVVKREPKINLTGAVLHCESCYQHETGTTISIIYYASPQW